MVSLSFCLPSQTATYSDESPTRTIPMRSKSAWHNHPNVKVCQVFRCFGGGCSTSTNSTSANSTSWPKSNWRKSKLAEVEIGRSRCWPKSKLVEVEIGSSWNWPKSKLAVVETGRSQISQTRKTSWEVEIGRSGSPLGDFFYGVQVFSSIFFGVEVLRSEGCVSFPPATVAD